jgi:hypothetical protein
MRNDTWNKMDRTYMKKLSEKTSGQKLWTAIMGFAL